MGFGTKLGHIESVLWCVPFQHGSVGSGCDGGGDAVVLARRGHEHHNLDVLTALVGVKDVAQCTREPAKVEHPLHRFVRYFLEGDGDTRAVGVEGFVVRVAAVQARDPLGSGDVTATCSTLSPHKRVDAQV